jgi:hypothetical protein
MPSGTELTLSHVGNANQTEGSNSLSFNGCIFSVGTGHTPSRERDPARISDWRLSTGGACLAGPQVLIGRAGERCEEQ